MPENRERRIQRRKEYRERLAAKGVCIVCFKNKVEAGKKTCTRCNRRNYEKQIARTKETGICFGCGKRPARTNKLTCEGCKERNVKSALRSRSKRQAERRESGLCLTCGRHPQLPTLSSEAKHRPCETCYLKEMARRNLGTSLAWEDLKAKLVSQDYTCAYSGVPLVLGVNASLDHIFPVTLYPHLKSDTANVQWVEWRVNQIKTNFHPDDFLALVEAIATHRLNLVSRTGGQMSAKVKRLISQSLTQTMPRKTKAVQV